MIFAIQQPVKPGAATPGGFWPFLWVCLIASWRDWIMCVWGGSLRMMGLGPCQLWWYEDACCCPPSEEQWWHLCICIVTQSINLAPGAGRTGLLLLTRDIIRGINNSDLSFVIKCRGNHGSFYTVLMTTLACVETYWKIHQRSRVVWKWCRYRADLLLQYMLNGATSWSSSNKSFLYDLILHLLYKNSQC